MTNKENRKPNLDTKAPPQADSELRYLLSAYAVGSVLHLVIPEAPPLVACYVVFRHLLQS